MIFLRRWALIALLGAVFGDIGSMLIAPAIIGWYNSTVDPSALCNCLSTARATARHMITAQGIGAGIGALIFLFFGALVAQARRKKLRAQQTAAAPPATS
jgi:hypothetical protein